MPPTYILCLLVKKQKAAVGVSRITSIFLAHIELLLDCYWHIVQMEALKCNVPALLYKLQV